MIKKIATGVCIAALLSFSATTTLAANAQVKQIRAEYKAKIKAVKAECKAKVEALKLQRKAAVQKTKAQRNAS